MLEIVGYSLLVEMVDNKTCSAWCCTLNSHHALFLIQGYDSPCALRWKLCGECALNERSCYLQEFALRESIDAYERCVFALLLNRTKVESFNLFANDGCVYDKHLRCTLVEWYPRTAKRPSCTCSHIKLYAVGFAFRINVSQYLHIARREERNIVFLISLHAIDRSNLDSANTMVGILAKIPL